MNANEFDVIIIGGGITGAGTQRDCAMRGLRTLLIERSDIATGATGRNHGLLHSGARYAVNDPESAEECIKENMILRRIAAHCIDETDGLFITLPEDDLGYQQNFVTFTLGTTLAEGQTAGSGAGEHMTSFDYAYKLEAVRDWLFQQTK